MGVIEQKKITCNKKYEISVKSKFDYTKCKRLCDNEFNCRFFFISRSGWCVTYESCNKRRTSSIGSTFKKKKETTNPPKTIDTSEMSTEMPPPKGPVFRCYNGVGANSVVANCEDMESGTKYCVKVTTLGVATRTCGLPSKIGPLKAGGQPVPGCKTVFGIETCVCSEEKCN